MHTRFRVNPSENGGESTENEYFEDIGRKSTSMANLIVKAGVKDELGEMNVAADFYDALDEEVSELLSDAQRRASENDRKTVQPRDL